MDKNIKTLLLAAGTAFMGESMILLTAQNFPYAIALGVVGVVFLTIREYMKDEPIVV